jgi:GNAT superfamily N-acetyltransferase
MKHKMDTWLKRSYRCRRRVRLQGKMSLDGREIQVFATGINHYIARIRWSRPLSDISTIHIDHLYVTKRWRNRGIGTRLLHDAAQCMKCVWVTLDDVSDRSGEQQNIYRNCGFECGNEPPTMISFPQGIIEKSRFHWRSKSKHTKHRSRNSSFFLQTGDERKTKKRKKKI